MSEVEPPRIEETAPESGGGAEPDPLPPRRRSRWPRRIAIAVAAVAALIAAAAALLDTSIGHRLLVDRIAALRPSNGLRYEIGRIEGSIYTRARLLNVRISDPSGAFLVIPRADLDWRPFAYLFSNRLQIEKLTIPRADLLKLPKTTPTGRTGPILPSFDIALGQLDVQRLRLAPAVTGVAREGRIAGRADIRDGRALVDLAAVVNGSDRLSFDLDAEPDRDRFHLNLVARGENGGVLSRLAGLPKDLAVEIAGNGRWTQWNGRAWAEAGGARIADLSLGNRAGAYTLAGRVAPASITQGKVQRLTAPYVRVEGAATFANRLLDGRLALRSEALAIEAAGALDLAKSSYRDLRIRADLLRAQALFPNMSGRAIQLRAILDGAFDTARFDYAISADRFAFDKTGFERARAAGSGRLSKSPVRLPIRFTAAQVTGVGDVAGGILRNLAVQGVLAITPKDISGNNLKLTSDKLDATIMLLLDLSTGRYEVGLAGQLNRYLIPGLGIVDVTSKLSVLPGAGGKGTRIIGTGTAQMVRLDNGFFRSQTGGLPRITSALERMPDGVMHFRNLVLTSPDLTLRGNGYRRNDGTFHFEGRGTQRTYGPLSLVLDGRIEKPTLDLRFERPNDSMGLRDVRARLNPTPEGFAFTAAGQSRLGAFEGNGAILLPRGGTPEIVIDRLDVAGTRANGRLAIVTGGFEGQLAFAGGGINGTLGFRPQEGHQRIEARLTAESARLAQGLSIRRGQVNAVILLDPAGTTIDATVTAQGIRQGSLSLARLAANVRLKQGEGQVRASIAGSRGRGFAIQSVTEIRNDRFIVQAQGTVDRRELRLVTPAVVLREAGGMRLQPTRLAFAGGEAEVSGRFGDGETAIDANLVRLPLSVLDIAVPGLALGGSASGKLAFVQREGAAPTGRIDMTVRGMTRSGLVLSSTPIDVALVGVLEPNKAAMRAVMASSGKTIGRAQALMTPLGQGDLERRLKAAPIRAQIRYNGPADTLWRLTGIELFDLSGPVALGADVAGSFDNPRIQGSVRSTNARLESAVTGTVLNNVETSGRFDGSRLQIDRFAAKDGRSGTVTGTGSFDFAARNGLGIDLRLQADGAQLINRDDIAATVTGPLTISSDGAGGTIGGDVRLDRARYRLGRASAAAAVPRINVREINLPWGSVDDEDAPATPWQLDIKARSPGQMIVTGLGLTSEWSGDFTIRGEPTNPSILGRADLVRGDYEFAGREFELERGIIRFDGRVPANPALDIEANADTQGLSASIRVTGAADRPDISFASVPALPEDELLSRLLFGTSITNLSAPEALQLAAAVAALQNGDGGLNPINAVRRAVGLDRLRILPADVQTGAATSVAAGKYITRNTYAEIITDGQGYSATRVEFQVTRWLSLLATISTVGRQSANIRVSRDY